MGRGGGVGRSWARPAEASLPSPSTPAADSRSHCHIQGEEPHTKGPAMSPGQVLRRAVQLRVSLPLAGQTVGSSQAPLPGGDPLRGHSASIPPSPAMLRFPDQEQEGCPRPSAGGGNKGSQPWDRPVCSCRPPLRGRVPPCWPTPEEDPRARGSTRLLASPAVLPGGCHPLAP